MIVFRLERQGRGLMRKAKTMNCFDMRNKAGEFL